jgi:phosphate uptake regulator
MSEEPEPTSLRARKRAARQILREGLIKRREAYFDLLVSGYSIEQIASHTKKVCQRSDARSVRPWRSGGSLRLRTPVSRWRG